MTKLKNTVDLSNTCGLSITDTSGFYDSVTNPNGFLPEANTDPIVADTYKISNGYFFNLILYNKYNADAVLTNPTELLMKVVTVDPIYANNFPAQVYTLTQDGSYTIKRFFLISDVFYNANVGSGLFTGKNVFYTDGTTVYNVISDVPVPTTFLEFLSDDLTNFTGLTLNTSFISTCFINKCYSKMMSLLLASDSGACDNSMTDVVNMRDFLYMTLETIKYLKEFNNITQIQKLLEATNICGGLCTSIANVTSSNCGCNG